MAERSVFVPAPDSTELVREVFFQVKWHSGFAVVQKEKNIKELHQAAARHGFRHLLGNIKQVEKRERATSQRLLHESENVKWKTDSIRVRISGKQSI